MDDHMANFEFTLKPNILMSHYFNSFVSRQPVASFLHLFFRLVALVMYLLCDWDGKNCESCFFTIIGLLSLDFWYVKNVSGRLLVGLHWWNQIDEDGNSFWVFEAKKRSPNTGTQTEARIFWLGFIICPLIWTIFFFTALFSWKIEWLLLVIPCFSLQVVNLHCYLRCKAGEQNGQQFFKQENFSFCSV
uniref:Golgi apparatus membrane protein TVP23 homolog n=1 Tax=Oryzias latipes TaxID=8090 RepID=A0A3P9LF33_ORYLA